MVGSCLNGRGRAIGSIDSAIFGIRTFIVLAEKPLLGVEFCPRIMDLFWYGRFQHASKVQAAQSPQAEPSRNHGVTP